MKPVPTVALGASVLLSFAFAGSPGPERPPRPSLGDQPDQQVVVTSEPPGALIVFGSDTLGPAPVSFRVDRRGISRIRRELHLLAVPVAADQCMQHRIVRYDEDTPDTIRFDMHRCPPRDQDYGRLFDEVDVMTPPEMVSSIPVRCADPLRQVGARGTVVFLAVIDTIGTVEPRTLRALLATDDIFAPPAREVLLHSRFAPGRVYETKVRTRVRVPIDISCTRAR